MRNALLAGLAALALTVSTALAAERVDLELILAADGSGSIDDDELMLQRKGWADALTSPEVLAGIRDGLTGSIAVMYFEWGGPSSQVVIVDWQIVRDEASARDFAQKLVSRPRGAYGYNSISNAVDFSVRQAEGNAFDGQRKVIDVSGDGPNIGGRPMELARRDAVEKGFTINALAIRRPGGRALRGEPLEDYYAREVIGGPGAFVEIADETRPFAIAARRKLVTEIAGVPAPTRHADSGAALRR